MIKKITICALSASLTVFHYTHATNTCYARLEADTLRMGNTRIERVFAWNGGAVRTLSLKDHSTGAVMQSVFDLPDFILAKESP